MASARRDPALRDRRRHRRARVHALATRSGCRRAAMAATGRRDRERAIRLASGSETAHAESSDVVVGRDGKPRCAWAGSGDSGLSRYHDDVWGKRTYDQSAMFEALTLGVFEVGLSWSTVFQKRDAFRKAFRDFDPTRIATMTERDVDRLLQDASIIRNRAKIQATIDNARAMLSASPSLVVLAKSCEISRERAPRSVADLPT